MNKVILMGRLTREPEVRYTQGDNSMCIARYTLAVDRRFTRGANNGDGNTADFISCVAFGRSGEFAEKYLRKGTKIAVTGRIQTGSYTNRDGVKVYTTEVVIEDQEFAESKNAQGAQGGYNGGSAGNTGHNAGNGGYNRNQNANQNAGNGSGMNTNNNGSNAGGYGGGQGSFQNQAPQGSSNEATIDGFMNIPDGIDEELPFA